MKEHKLRFRAQLSAQRDDEYMVLFIREGEANGWTFTRRVLEQSAPLWESCPVFVDHAAWGRSVRDLGAVLSGVGWSVAENGLTARLTPEGPSREIVREAAAIMLSDGPRPDLGFSADVVFAADAQGCVQKIVRPLSVDLVIDPAFATGFIRQVNQNALRRGGAGRKANTTRDDNSACAPTLQPQPDNERSNMQDHTEVLREKEKEPLRSLLEAQQVEAGRQLLRLALRNADLPEPAENDIRARFEGKPFEPEELERAVKAYKDSLAAATAPDEIKGPARTSGMMDSRDQFQAAIDDLIGAPREKGAENLKVARLSGIREAYTAMTGDLDFRGGYHPEHVRFQHVAASFPGLLANALNKSLADHWQQLGKAGYDWWQKIVTVEHFNSVQDISWLLCGTIGSLPTVADGAEYTELKIGDSKETSSFTKYGGYVGITLEAMDKDDTRKLRLIPRELANAGLRNLSSLIAAIFTTNSAAGPLMADTGALFNAVAVTTKGGHANLLTAQLGTDYTAWNAVALAMYDQPMLIASETGYYGTGSKAAIDPKYCLVPRALKSQAEALFMPRWQSEVQAVATNGGPTWGGRVEVITVPEWTDTADWAAAIDPVLMPGIMVGERFGLLPQIFTAGNETDPAMFANDESRIKVRHFLAVGVADFRPLHKSNV